MISEAGNRMLDNMPQYYLTSIVMRTIWDAQGREIDQLCQALDEVLKQFFVSTATWVIDRWEQELGIVSDPNKPIEQRRSVVMTQLKGFGTATINLLQKVAESFEYGKIDVIEDIPNYSVKIVFVDRTGQPPNLADFENALRKVLPAHLNFTIEFNYFTWQELDEMLWTWDTFDGLSLTWDELEVYA